MRQLSKKSDLSERSGWNSFVSVLDTDNLECNNAPEFAVVGFVYFAVRTLTKFLFDAEAILLLLGQAAVRSAFHARVLFVT